MVVVVVWMYTTWTFQQLLHISFQNIESKSSFFYHYRRRSLRLRRFDDRTIFLFLFFSCFHCVPASYFSRFFSTSSSLLLLFWVLQQFSMSSHHHSLRFIFLSRRWLCFFLVDFFTVISLDDNEMMAIIVTNFLVENKRMFFFVLFWKITIIFVAVDIGLWPSLAIVINSLFLSFVINARILFDGNKKNSIYLLIKLLMVTKKTAVKTNGEKLFRNTTRGFFYDCRYEFWIFFLNFIWWSNSMIFSIDSVRYMVDWIWTSK